MVPKTSIPQIHFRSTSHANHIKGQTVFSYVRWSGATYELICRHGPSLTWKTSYPIASCSGNQTIGCVAPRAILSD